MNINSIIGSSVVFTAQSASTTVSGNPPSMASSLNTRTLSNQIEKPIATIANANTKATPANENTSTTENEIHNKPVRTMSHIVETYNLHGKPRIKFMDSHNNVIYQIPSEMVAKTEDLMKNAVMYPTTKARILFFFSNSINASLPPTHSPARAKSD